MGPDLTDDLQRGSDIRSGCGVSVCARPWQSVRVPRSLPTTAPRLEEAPLVLREFGDADVALIQEAASDPLIP